MPCQALQHKAHFAHDILCCNVLLSKELAQPFTHASHDILRIVRTQIMCIARFTIMQDAATQCVI